MSPSANIIEIVFSHIMNMCGFYVTMPSYVTFVIPSVFSRSAMHLHACFLCQLCALYIEFSALQHLPFFHALCNCV